MPCLQLESERLLLRPPEPDDARAMTALAGEYDVAKNLATMPHPYRLPDAEEFLARIAEKRAAGTDFVFAIVKKDDSTFLGTIGLHLKAGVFELGYWLGKPFWGQGFAAEAARKMACFAFKDLQAERLVAGWFHDNPASGKVLGKLGFVPNGAEQRNSLARGHEVYCHRMVLAREDFGRKKAAA